jgi:LAO/AO transport system kinase
VTTLIDRIRSGDVRSIARAATTIENRRPEAEKLLTRLFPFTGGAVTIGITGPPGAGKSTLVAQLVTALRAENRKVGVLAVDPTSPYTGGAILGDRIRMQEHYGDPSVFIRSMASRGRLGGLASATMDLVLLLDTGGMDTIVIETVGVGQDEVDIARLADVTVLVLVPGMGDDVQAIKAGIMEIADVYVINKADLPGAGRLQLEIEAQLSLAHRADGWVPPIVQCVASEGKGTADILTAVRSFRASCSRQGRMLENWTLRLREMFRERVTERIGVTELRAAAEEVGSRRRDPYSIVNEWLERH